MIERSATVEVLERCLLLSAGQADPTFGIGGVLSLNLPAHSQVIGVHAGDLYYTRSFGAEDGIINAGDQTRLVAIDGALVAIDGALPAIAGATSTVAAKMICSPTIPSPSRRACG